MMTTRKMTLSEARDELERQGFSCVDNEQSNMLVGVLSECRWGMSAKMDVMVFIHHVEENLTIERIEKDLRELPDLVLDHYTGGCPPFGASRVRMILQVYLTDQHIESDALGKILTAPSSDWCSVTFLAAQDGEGLSRFYESSTPFWGAALYPEIRYWAGLLTGREAFPSQRPSTNKKLIYLNIFVLVYVIFILAVSDQRWLMVVPFMGFMVLLFGGAAVYNWCVRRGRRNPNGRSADNGFVLLEANEHMV